MIFVAVHRLSQAATRGAALYLWYAGFSCSGFSCGAQALGCGLRSCGAQSRGGCSLVVVCSFQLQWLLLWSAGFRVHQLQQLRLAGSRAWAQEPQCTVPGARLSRPGIEPMSPTLAGGHPTIGPPGRPSNYVLIEISELTIVYM